jgi:hypothetical protein
LPPEFNSIKHVNLLFCRVIHLSPYVGTEPPVPHLPYEICVGYEDALLVSPLDDTEASEKEVSTRTVLTPRHPGKMRSGFVGSVRVKRLGVRVECGGCGKNLFFVTRKTGESRARIRTKFVLELDWFGRREPLKKKKKEKGGSNSYKVRFGACLV